MKDIAFGQYYPANSFVHKMDARIKILMVILYIVMIFFIKTFAGFGLVTAFLLFAILIARLPILKVIKSVRAILFIVLVTFVINLLFHTAENEKVYFELWRLKISDKSIEFSVFMALRIIFLVFGSSILTLTTTPVSLTDGIESLLKPLKIFHFPAHELALVMSIALRFIPTLMEETGRIINAQKARGASFESGGLIKRAKALLPVLVPLLVSAIRRAEDLGDAMDARCYSASKNRTKYKKMKLTWRDLIGSLVLILVFAGIITINYFQVAVI